MLLCVNDQLVPQLGSTNRLAYLRVPVLFGDSVQAAEHDGKDLVNVFLDEAENVLVIPEVQCSLRDLQRQEE